MSITSNNLKVREVVNQVVNDPDYRSVSSVPLISIHQLGLIFIAYFGVFAGMALHVYGGVSLWIVYPIMIFSFYTAFTPLHDATHRARRMPLGASSRRARRRRLENELRQGEADRETSAALLGSGPPRLGFPHATVVRQA